MLACSSTDHASLDSFFVIDSFVDNLVDPVGAGDALLAYSTLTMLVNRDTIQSTIIGTLAAGCECEFDGNVPVTPDHVHKKLDQIERRMNYA